MMLGLLALPAAAEPWLDPAAGAGAECVRTSGADAFVGDGRWAPEEVRRKLGADAGCAWAVAAPVGRLFDVVPSVRTAAGSAVPDNLSGDEEFGRFSTNVGVEAVATGEGYTLRARPTLEAGVGGLPSDGTVAATPRLDTLWGELRWKGLGIGAGVRDRWLGPGRHGALLLSDNARPPWLATGTAEGRLPGWADRFGRFRAEVGAGVLAEPRDDVARPGLLLMDMRWLPVPWIELGATRMSIFGGVGRPPVDVGQLLVPTEPHVYDDPDQLLPDQDEIAALDLRVALPIGRWFDVPVSYAEGWWQYGGEDVIAREVGPIPYPSLAGVGNLYGGAVHAGPVVLTGEYTRLLDDYFRWYVGHRVYHDGFTQDGRSMGHFGGTDSETAFGSVGWEGGAARGPRARLWADWTRRVGVIEALNDKLFTLMTEEHRGRGGADLQWPLSGGAWLTGGYSYERITGAGFVPGAAEDLHRIYLGWSPAPLAVGGRRAATAGGSATP